MHLTDSTSELKKLFRETQIRYPNQPLEAETQKAYLEDWKAKVKEVGLARFVEGVKRARNYSNFFPMMADIVPLIPGRNDDGAAMKREWRELWRRKEAGEKFYTIQDVFSEFARRIKSGEIKPRDAGWIEWAKKYS